MGPRSPEGRAAKAIVDKLNDYDIQENVIAYALSNANLHIQKKLFNVFMHLVKIWAGRYDAGIIDDTDFGMLVNSKRIQEALERYGYIFE